MDVSKLKNMRIALVAIFIGVILGVAGFYFLYFVRTPEYSLHLVQSAVQKHDVMTFKRHVDVESVVGHAYDDFAAVSMDNDGSDNLGSALAKAMVVLMKEPATKVISDAVIKYVETGADSDSSDSADGHDYKQVEENMGYRDLTFVGIGSSYNDGVNAIVPVRFKSEQLNDEVVLNIKMRELSDGKWQIFAVDGLRDFMKNG